MPRSDQTEKPTPRRKREAKREGRIPKSPEVAVAAGMLLTLLSLRVVAPLAGRVVMDETSHVFSSLAEANLAVLGPSIASIVLVAVVPVMGMAVVAALVSGFGQVGFVYAPKAAAPKLSNLSPRKGLQKFKPGTAGWELVKSATKLGLLVAVAWGPLVSAAEAVATSGGFNSGVGEVISGAWVILLRVAALTVLIAAADYGINFYRTNRELKMSVQEIKQESKDSEGSPEMKSRRRQRASELSRNRMISASTTADVVVTNPTHLAVALKYEAGEPAPKVVAKGADRLARKIRKAARRHGVPVIEDKPLARTLFRKVNVGHYVPTALFEAVAFLLALAYKRRARR